MQLTVAVHRGRKGGEHGYPADELEADDTLEDAEVVELCAQGDAVGVAGAGALLLGTAVLDHFGFGVGFLGCHGGGRDGDEVTRLEEMKRVRGIQGERKGRGGYQSRRATSESATTFGFARVFISCPRQGASLRCEPGGKRGFWSRIGEFREKKGDGEREKLAFPPPRPSLGFPA